MLILLRYNTMSLNANHRCSKKRFFICSQNFHHPSHKVHECSVQRPKLNVTNASNINVFGSSTQMSNELEEEPIVDDACFWFFDIETEQSRNKRNFFSSFLSGAKSRRTWTRLFWLGLCCRRSWFSLWRRSRSSRTWMVYCALWQWIWFCAHFSMVV